MAASRSSRVTRSSVGLNGLDEKFCGRTLRNRSIAQPEESSASPQPRARSPKKKQDGRQESKQDTNKDTRQESKQDAKKESKRDINKDSKQESKPESSKDSKQESRPESSKDSKQESKPESSKDSKQESRPESSKDSKQESRPESGKDSKQESRPESSKDSKQESRPESSKDSKQESRPDSSKDSKQESKPDSSKDSRQESKPDSSKDSKQESKPESSKDSKQESKPDIISKDPKHESNQYINKIFRQVSKQDTNKDSTQESKQDTSKDANVLSRQDAIKESRRESNDNNQDTKQDTGEEFNQDLELESKHAANQDTKLQDSQQLDVLQRNIADSSVPASDADHSTVSRKRGLSCLDKDPNQDESENCDTGKEWRDGFPQIKRAKQRSLSGEFLGHEEDQRFLNPQSQVSFSEPCTDIICEDLASCNSCNSPPASSNLSEQEGGLTGRPAKEDHCVDCDGTVLSQNFPSNGLGEVDAEETSTVADHPSAPPTSATSLPPLLNGSQVEAPSSPSPSVPFRNSVPGQVEISGSGESPASSALTFTGAEERPAPGSAAKEQEVEELEVDVVGDPLCLAREEQVTVSEGETNGRPPSPVPQPAASTSPSVANVNCSSVNNGNSGETTPTLTTPPSPTECNPSMSSMPPSFTELYEHRYTLRTSPRRVVSGGEECPSKPSSPLTDNGPFREEGEVEDDCPVLEEPSCSDSGGPSADEPGSLNPAYRVADKDSGFAEDKDVENGKELARRQAVEDEEEEEEEEEPDVYYFESDHLALKHNKDYQRLLQTIVVLEAQRAQAILDLETLARRQREALADPISFVEQLQKQGSLGLPCPQRVVQLPDIAWEQYTSGLGEFEREFCDKKRKTRQLNLIFDKGLPLRPKSPVEPKKEGEPSTVYSSLPTSDAPENGRQTQMIRGRICHPNKPDTFNQLWTVEEQKKLEQLLLKFPPEEVESKRWQKIADELGNRTAKQVASRVQKYFIKLTKAGIPVPGRTPNLCMYTKKASSKRQHHLNKHLYRPSTFLTSYEPPVFMDDDDERSAYYNSVQDPSADDSDEEGVPAELRSLPEYKELLQLKRLKKQKLQEIREDNAGVQHMGFKCDVCGMEPIQGVRWHCQDCPPENSVDFCSNCSDCLLKTETHKPTHHLEPVYRSETFLDRDYCLPQSAGYNYLDPNYFPANR
ncbi:ZZ-type zinc finger-containing protein 3 isoform X4 [Fundulus heteroclitus]|uniref:ZZ-type zinc finger-containing protein 3 isoform X4 n=1 Tax=Fundulus heteroclitus TaxID=8078 RepID=UPI00165B53C1|nr:ZZ-type zinc finger-containing protein 3 isoform X4 [Fundulus heteroclitus]